MDKCKTELSSCLQRPPAPATTSPQLYTEPTTSPPPPPTPYTSEPAQCPPCQPTASHCQPCDCSTTGQSPALPARGEYSPTGEDSLSLPATTSALTSGSLAVPAQLAEVEAAIEQLHGREIDLFDKMKVGISQQLADQAETVGRRMREQKSVISSLIEENSRMRSLQAKLVARVRQQKLSSVGKDVYQSCIEETEKFKKVAVKIGPIMRKLKDVFLTFKTQGMSGLLRSRAELAATVGQERTRANMAQKKLVAQKKNAEVLATNVNRFLVEIRQLLQNYFGIKLNLKNLKNLNLKKNSNFAELASGLATVQDSVTGLYSKFALNIRQEEEKVGLQYY